MQKRNQTTRPMDNQSEDYRRVMRATLETTEAAETDFTELICLKSYHFASEESILQEAAQRPDIFLQCCHSLFGEMLADVDEIPHHPTAHTMAEAFFILFGELAYLENQSKMQIILDAVLDGVQKAGDKMRKEELCQN